MKRMIFTLLALVSLCAVGQVKAQSPFVNERTYTGAELPYYSILADFAGDGIQDIASSHFGDHLTEMGTIGIKRGNGDGTFQGTEFYKVGLGSLGISAGDLNGDTWP